MQTDEEAQHQQQEPSADPVGVAVAQPVAVVEGVVTERTMPQRTVIIVSEPGAAIWADGHQEYFLENEDERDPNEEMLPCAICGFIFSWIPLVGMITFCVNMNAPRRSLRRTFAQSACCVATFVILFNLIFWPAAYRR